MRDLFTSPSVSFAYERGWRQGFAAAGFPGADAEFELANEYFEPAIERRRRGGGEGSVLVDMSCATGELYFGAPRRLPIFRSSRLSLVDRLSLKIGAFVRFTYFRSFPAQVSSRVDSPRARNTRG